MFALLTTVPLLTGIAAVLIFRWSFYGIKHNKWGTKPSKDIHHYLPILGGDKDDDLATMGEKKRTRAHKGSIIGWPEDRTKRRQVLIATLEYEIIDWKLKVK
jgi:alpha-1,3-glucan synthase